MFQEDDDDQGNWEDNKDDWSKWYHEDAHTAREEDSKDSSFVVISEGKTQSEVEASPSKAGKGSDPDIMEALKMVIANNQKTVEMVINSQKEKSTSEEDKLDQED